MKIKYLACGVALLIFPALLYAQAGFRSASIVSLKGDTTKGLIRYEGWTRSPFEVQFKQNADAQVRVLYPKDIKSFEITGIEEYISYTGPVSTNKIDFREIGYTRDTSTKEVTTFLKVAASGPNVKLLAHRDEIRTAYFIKDHEDLPQELKFYRYYNDNDRIETSAPFRQVLISLLEKYRGVNEKWFREVGVADYSLSALKRITNNINNNESKDFSTWGFRFFVGAEAAYQHITFNGPERYRYDRVNDNIVPVFNIGYDLYANKFAPKTIFRVEAGLSNITSSFESPYLIFTFKAIVASLKPQVLFNFNTKGKIRPFVGAGLAVNFPFESENKAVVNPKATPSPGTQMILINGDTRGYLLVGQSFDQPFSKSTVFVNPEAKAGVSFNRKFEAVATAGMMGTNILKSAQPMYMNYYSFGIKYYLSGTK